jgi:xanthine dehydrogenase accessory factor
VHAGTVSGLEGGAEENGMLPDLEGWRAAGHRWTVATVIKTWGSAPRGVGGKMAVRDDGRIAGSVSGGCVEAAVVDASREVLQSGLPRLLEFGVADETAWAVGLACGGRIEIFVEPKGDLDDAMAHLGRQDRAVAMVTLVRGAPDLLGRKLLVDAEGNTQGSLGALDAAACAAAAAALTEGRSGRAALPECEAFIDVMLPPPTLVAVGGVHIAVVLTSLARHLGYRTVVIDPRPAFGSSERFPHVDRLVPVWPDEALGEIGLTPNTAVAVLTHDPKLDDPALRAALPSPAFYVGALGSQATQAKRRQRLLDAGLGEAEIARLRAPIGLDLGGRSPEEIALSVMAQIVAVRHGRNG